MNKKELKHIVDCNAEKMMKKLGLEEWQIEFEYKMPDKHKNLRGSCGVHAQAKRAIIVLNPRLLVTEERVISVLQHELVHLLVKTFCNYRDIVHKFIHASPLPATKREFIMLNEIFNSAQEEATYSICRALERYVEY